jgi:hypothetical protein
MFEDKEDISCNGTGVFYFPWRGETRTSVGSYMIEELRLHFPKHVHSKLSKKKNKSCPPASRLVPDWLLLTRPDCNQKRLVASLRALARQIERKGLCVGTDYERGDVYFKNGKLKAAG